MALKAGEPATKTIYLAYDGGYTDAHLVPVDEPGERGMVLVVEGDEVTENQVRLYREAGERKRARAEARAEAEAAEKAAAKGSSGSGSSGEKDEDPDSGAGSTGSTSRSSS